jgi:hypothetical protein
LGGIKKMSLRARNGDLRAKFRYYMKPFRPGLFQFKGGLDFVENPLREVQFTRLSQQLQAIGLTKVDDRSGIANDGSH